VAPALPTEPFDQMRALLVAGAADGRAGKAGKDLIEDLDKARQALADGNKKRAADRLRSIQKNLENGADDEEIDRDFARQALDGLRTIATTYELDLSSHGGK